MIGRWITVVPLSWCPWAPSNSQNAALWLHDIIIHSISCQTTEQQSTHPCYNCMIWSRQSSTHPNEQCSQTLWICVYEKGSEEKHAHRLLKGKWWKTAPSFATAQKSSAQAPPVLHPRHPVKTHTLKFKNITTWALKRQNIQSVKFIILPESSKTLTGTSIDKLLNAFNWARGYTRIRTDILLGQCSMANSRMIPLNPN